MPLQRIEYKDYAEIFNNTFIPYNTVAFNLINIKKCDRLDFLLFQEDKILIGLIGGVKENILLVPFSAPFSFFNFNDGNVRTEYIIKAISELDGYLIYNKFFKVQFTLPPYFYNEQLISKTIFSFYLNNYSLRVDDNHFFIRKDYIKYENNTIGKGIRYNLKIAHNNGLLFKKAGNIDEKRLVYDIIKQNKETKNRQLSMTFEEILDMERLVKVDYLLVFFEGQAICSSIVYIYFSGIVQVIHWGDLPGFKNYYPMNFLAMNLFRLYTEDGFEFIDLGSSSKNSVPNYGLSNFKESIGCSTTLKFTFTKQFNLI